MDTNPLTRGFLTSNSTGIGPATRGWIHTRARELFAIPAHHEAWTALAIGHPAQAEELPDALRERDLTPRTRKPTGQFVFSGTWGTSAPVTRVSA